MAWLPDGEKIFIRFGATHERDGHRAVKNNNTEVDFLSVAAIVF